MIRELRGCISDARGCMRDVRRTLTGLCWAAAWIIAAIVALWLADF